MNVIRMFTAEIYIKIHAPRDPDNADARRYNGCTITHELAAFR